MAYNTSISAEFPEIWLPTMQKIRDNYTVAPKIAEFFSNEQLKYGDKFHKPYGGRVILEDSTKGTDLSSQSWSSTDENFTIETRKSVRVQMSAQDKKQSMYNVQTALARAYQNAANKHIDSIVLGEYSNAGDDIYNDDIGGSGSTTACALNAGNISRVFTAANAKLKHLTRGQTDGQKIAVLSPNMYQNLELYFGGRETILGDKTYLAGQSLNAFGFKIYASNLLTFTATWTPANNPTDEQTITINGVTITFESSLTGAGAGSVLIGNDTATTLDNLVALLNDPLNRNSSSNYVAFSLADAELLEGCVPTDGTTYMSIVFKGGGDCVVATSDTDDAWSSQVTHGIVGLEKFTAFAMQLFPNTVWKEEPYQPGGEGSWIMDFFYGYKTWTKDGSEKFLDLNVDASGNN